MDEKTRIRQQVYSDIVLRGTSLTFPIAYARFGIRLNCWSEVRFTGDKLSGEALGQDPGATAVEGANAARGMLGTKRLAAKESVG